MYQIPIAILIWLAVILPAFGESTVIPVTPKDMGGLGLFTFAVTNSTATNGMSFQVVITAKSGSVLADSKGYLCATKLTGESRNIGPMTPETQVTLKTSGRTSIADFVASSQLLGKPDACFVFAIYYRGPSADFYVLKLRDFAKR
jgi:hypothetical protein